MEVVCKDRNNLLMDISAALSTGKAGVASLKVHTTTDGFAIFYLTIQVTDKAHLDIIMAKLRNISSVIKITRTAG